MRQRISQHRTRNRRIGISLGLVDPERERHIRSALQVGELARCPRFTSCHGYIRPGDNDANAAALAELWLARPEILDARDFIFVLVEEGLGTGSFSTDRFIMV
jgi:predicted NBD/HSP70 family sugar kinase